MLTSIAEMEQMLDAYLAFARGLEDEPSKVTNLSDLCTEVADDAKRKGGDLKVNCPTDLELPLRRASFKRCLTNLVNNAESYGSVVSLSAWRQPNKWIEIAIDDDGPGIPDDQREEAFRPFHRLDEARNLEKGGSGLGLAIARDIARSHGGDIILDTSPLGGVRALVSLPA